MHEAFSMSHEVIDGAALPSGGEGANGNTLQTLITRKRSEVDKFC